MSEMPCMAGCPKASFQTVWARQPATSQQSGKAISDHRSTTVATIGLRARIGRSRSAWSGTERNQQIAELVQGDAIAGLDCGRAIELFQDRGPIERGIDRQL